MRTRLGWAVTGVLVAIFAAPQAASAVSRVPGIDVSRFQRTIDWERVAGDGVQFAFVQASRGSGTDCSVVPRECGADSYYARNYSAAKAAGLRVGPYHRAFVDGARGRAGVRADARAEAGVFIAAVGQLERGDLRPALDMEAPFAGMGSGSLRLWTRTWLNQVRAALGWKPIIYTNVASWRALGNPTSFARRGHPLWVANWNVAAPLVPAGNWAGQSWRIWQHSSRGRVDGIAGRVDLNRLRGEWNGVSVTSLRRQRPT